MKTEKETEHVYIGLDLIRTFMFLELVFWLVFWLISTRYSKNWLFLKTYDYLNDV